MRVAKAILLGLICGPLAVLFIAWVGGCAIISVDKGDAVAKNEAALNQLHQYPGAKLTADYSLGVPGGPGWNENGPPYKGYNTFRMYQLAHPMFAADLLTYFQHSMPPQWRWVINPNGCAANLTSPEGVTVYLQVAANGGDMCSGDTTSYRMEVDQG